MINIIIIIIDINVIIPIPHHNQKHYHHIQEHWNLDHWHHDDVLPEGEDILARLQGGGDQKSINW